MLLHCWYITLTSDMKMLLIFLNIANVGDVILLVYIQQNPNFGYENAVNFCGVLYILF